MAHLLLVPAAGHAPVQMTHDGPVSRTSTSIPPSRARPGDGVRAAVAGRRMPTWTSHICMQRLLGRIVGMIKPLEAKAMPDYCLWIRFSDGVEGEVDLSALVGQGVFEAWKDPGAFKDVTIGPGRSLSWGDEIDLCADSLYLEITGKKPEEVFEKLRTAEVNA